VGKHVSVRVLRADGILRVDLRHLDNNERFTRAGVWLGCENWWQLVNGGAADLENAKALSLKTEVHLKGPVYGSFNPLMSGVDIRRYFYPVHKEGASKKATKKGVYFSPESWKEFNTLFFEINQLMGMDNFTPCHLQDDHLNQIGMLRCPDCNPASYSEWNI